MSNEFVACDIISTICIKQECEDNGCIDDTVIISSTTTNMENPELKNHINCDNISQHETSIADNIKTECLFFDVPNNIVNDQIKEEATAFNDVNIVLKRERLFCDGCCEEYQDYCTRCRMLEHILNGNTNNGTMDGLPKDILEIQYSLEYFHVFALKEIPDGVKFGPFVGLCALEYTWKVKDGKLLVGDDKKDILNWMQYINSTEDISKQNLDIFQWEGNLYYRTSRTVQKGEELLVHFGEEYEASMRGNIEMDFHPAIDWDIKNVYACTFCCLGFSSELYLSQHKSICPYKVYDNFTDEELTQCPSCKIYLGQQEYLEYHVTYCDVKASRPAVASSPQHQLVKGHLFTLKEHKRRQQLLYKCELCQYRTSYKSDLKAHVNKHYIVKMYGCEICHRRFKTEEAFRLHATNAHVKLEEGESEERSAGYYSKARPAKDRVGSCGENKQFACSKCDFKTRSRRSLWEHATSKHLEDAKYNCSQCKYKVNVKSLLKVHIKSKHLGEYAYRCAQCEYKTNYKSCLAKHVKIKHVGEKEHKCSECDYEAGRRSHLENHIKEKHVGEKDYKCAECQYQTSRKSSLEYHIKGKHINDKKYKCLECGFRTSYQSSLGEHIKVRHREKCDYKCTQCEYETRKMKYLKLHVQSKHIRVKEYKCPECSYEAICKGLVDRHVRVKHRNEKSHRCEECEFVTSYRTNLVAHIKAKHLNVSYKCPQCDYVTSYKSQLKTHVNAKHGGAKEYKCAECPYESSNKACLKRHINRRHGNRIYYRCTKCTFKSEVESALEMHTKVRHLNVKPYKCEICGYATKRPSELARHVKAKHVNEKEYKCSECDHETSYKSVLELHMKTQHMKVKDHRCPDCEYESVSKAYLQRHIKERHPKERDASLQKVESIKPETNDL